MPRLPWHHGPDVVFRRQGGTPPPDYEALEVAADGTFTLWRTIARVSRPPTPIGRFAGSLDDAQRGDLDALLERCGKAEPVSLGPPAGAAVDKVILGKRTSTWAEDATPPAPWDGLAALLRGFLGELTRHPAAAVGLAGPVLTHLGAEPLELDLSGATVRAVRWEEGAAVDTWQAEVSGPRSVTATPGWSFEVPFAHPFAPDAEVTAHVDNLLAFDRQFWRACSLQTVPSGTR